jgi:tRNA-Thr(GGU) m(6)t(6)A37 methyltransferase TsaA
MCQPRTIDLTTDGLLLKVIGRIRSTLGATAEAPRQGDEGAPDAWLVLEPEYVAALKGIAAGDPLIVLTWLHEARRDLLQIHPRGDPDAPLTGVFATRSPHRPNPVGVHPVYVRTVEDGRLRIGPIEAIDGTPVVDIKVALAPIGEW